MEQPQLEARLREIQDKINDCIGRFASLNDQIHEAEDQQSEAVETLSRLTGQLQEAKACREEAQRQKTEITQRLASTSADAESLQREIAQISRLLEEENKKDLQDVLEQQRSRLALCRNQLAQQEMDLAAKEEALKDTAAELETVQTENAQKTAQLQQLEQEYRQARQEADALSRQDRQLAEVAERLKQMRDVADALRGDSGLLEPMYDRKPFALDDVLQSGFQQAETAISGLRQAIVSYQEICGGSHTD